MAWIIFESIEYKDNLVSKKGTPFTGYVLKGTKKAVPGLGEEDSPYEKILFENRAVTVIENGIARPGISVVQFFQKACKPGDLVIMKSVRRSGRWELDSVELGRNNKGAVALDYVPLTEEETTRATAGSVNLQDPTRPRTPHQAPLSYVPA